MIGSNQQLLKSFSISVEESLIGSLNASCGDQTVFCVQSYNQKESLPKDTASASVQKLRTVSIFMWTSGFSFKIAESLQEME